jgi:EmrB/QacA subfamily drug resistance transporter
MDTSRSETGASTGRLTTRAMWAVLAVVIIADVMDLLDATITNIGAPTIVRELGGGELLVKWLGSSYALALGVLLVMGGRLGDRFGQRRLFLIGIAGFTLASLACGLSVSPGMLVGARLCQGAFGALLIPQGIAIMTAHFSRDMMRRAFSVFGPAMGLAMVAGPLVAGFLIDANIAGLSWRPMFLINIALGTVGLFIALRVLPRDAGDRSIVLDGLGAGLLALAMFGLLFGLIEGSSTGWTLLPFASIGVGLVAFALFAYRQKTAAQPLIKSSLLKDRGFTSGLVMGLVFFAAIGGMNYVVALFLQLGLGLTPSRAALAFVPLVLGIVAASVVAIGLIEKLGRLLILAGLLITLAGVGWLLQVVLLQGTSAGPWSLAPALLIMGFGMGTCFGTLFDVTLGGISADEAGSASGSLSAVQQLSTAVGAAVMTTIYFRLLASAGQTHAVVVSLIVVEAVTVLCLGLVWLLPRAARAEAEPGPEAEPGAAGGEETSSASAA